jgi:hypothetical protein
MTRVLRFRNFGVYVADERGERHHSPHCHIKDRARRIASVHLVSLEVIVEIAAVPPELMELIAENQNELIAEWERLNS